MSRSHGDRVDDILHAIDRCLKYRQHLMSPAPDLGTMAYDAILRNLAVIGEATRALPEETTAAIPEIPWAAISGLRNVVIHEYFRVEPEVIVDIVDNQLVPLSRALRDPNPRMGMRG